MNRLIRVDMCSKTISECSVEEKFETLGGRGLTSAIVSEEVPPRCDPLGPLNKLIFAPGMLAGGYASSTNRISVGGKSPLTGGIKESNAGGTTAFYLAQHGIKAIILEGIAREGLYILHVTDSGCFLEQADKLKGLDTFATVDQLNNEYGSKTAIAVIGPAGEQRLAAAGIAHLDLDGKPNRYCGRGGLGAVMGAKGLKAIVIQKSANNRAGIYDPVRWRDLIKEYAGVIKNNPATGKRLPLYGTSSTLDTVSELGALPTLNFRLGTFDKSEELSSQKLRDLILERGGEGLTTHSCMPGCLVRCSNRFPDENGNVKVAPLEYETIAMFGPNLGISSFDSIAEMNRLCNLLGLDTVEIGAALGVCAEAGIISFGDAEGAIGLIKEVVSGSVLGRVIGQGTAITGKVFGVNRVPTVKGQSLAGYEPRAMKGNGVVYATSPMGADHTAGNAMKTTVDHLKPEGQVQISRELQISMAAYDTLGFCILSGAAITASKEISLGLINARLGTNWAWDDITTLGNKVMGIEVDFNRRAGFTVEDDRLPEFMSSEAIPPHNTVWDVPEAELTGIWQKLKQG